MNDNMYTVMLASPTVVNTHPIKRGDGELRYPSECPLAVCEDEAKRLFDNNLLTEEPEAVIADDDLDDNDDDGLEKLKVAELNVIVIKEGVALNDATKKDDIIAAIRKHRDTAEG